MMNRDDDKLNAIKDILHREDILSKEDADLFVFDLGDIVDDWPKFPIELSKINEALANLRAHPENARRELRYLWRWMEHLRFHMRRAMYAIDKATHRMDLKYPFLVQDEEGDEDEEEKGE